MKFRSVAQRFGAKVSAASTAAFGLMASAHAAVPESVTTGLTDAKADALAVGGLVIGIVIAIAGFKYIKRAMS